MTETAAALRVPFGAGAPGGLLARGGSVERIMNTVTIEVASRKQSDARFARAIFERTDDVGIVFPCDAVHVDFMLQPSALAA